MRGRGAAYFFSLFTFNYWEGRVIDISNLLLRVPVEDVVEVECAASNLACPLKDVDGGADPCLVQGRVQVEREADRVVREVEAEAATVRNVLE